MSAALAIAAASNAQSAAAAEEARQAHVAACRVEIGAYDSHGATVNQMQAYAECVETVYPQPMGPAGLHVLQFLIIATLIGLVLGVLRPSLAVGRADLGDRFFGGFMGAIGGLLTSVAFCAVCWGLWFLYTSFGGTP